MTHQPDHEVELYDDGDVYHVFVDLPGFESDDLEVRWQSGRLSVSAEGSTDGGSARVFHKQVTLPRQVRVEGIDATYRDDVLDVVLPIENGSEPPGRRIEIRE